MHGEYGWGANNWTSGRGGGIRGWTSRVEVVFGWIPPRHDQHPTSRNPTLLHPLATQPAHNSDAMHTGGGITDEYVSHLIIADSRSFLPQIVGVRRLLPPPTHLPTCPQSTTDGSSSTPRSTPSPARRSCTKSPNASSPPPPPTMAASAPARRPARDHARRRVTGEIGVSADAIAAGRAR